MPSGGKKSAAAVRKFTSVGILKIRKERITSEKVALGHMIYRSYSVKKKNFSSRLPQTQKLFTLTVKLTDVDQQSLMHH